MREVVSPRTVSLTVGLPLGSTTKTREQQDASALIVSGVGIGVLGAVAAVIGGAVCPVCVVAAPALIGIGAFRRWRAARPVPPSPTGKRP